MERVRFCRNCGELLEDRWLHCPWCGDGAPRDEPSWDDMVDVSFDSAEDVLARGRLGKLDSLSGKLHELESELDAFLASRS